MYNNINQNIIIKQYNEKKFSDLTISDAPVRMIEIGSGLCRGPEWQSGKWPIVKGSISAQDCANSCATKKGCTAFDLSEKEGSKFSCFLYGHKDVEPASGLKGCLIWKDNFNVSSKIWEISIFNCCILRFTTFAMNSKHVYSL